MKQWSINNVTLLLVKFKLNIKNFSLNTLCNVQILGLKQKIIIINKQH